MKTSEMDIEGLVEFAARECLSAQVVLRDGRHWDSVPLGINNPLHPGKDFFLDLSELVGVNFDEVERLVLLDPFTGAPLSAETEVWNSDLEFKQGD